MIEPAGIETTPFPGTLVPKENAAAIISEFLARYRVYTKDRPTYIPTWCTFPEGNIVDESIFSSTEFLKYDIVYFYFEIGVKLYRASPKEVNKFFSNRNPWENKDYYIFDPRLDWCVAATHENDIILVGSLGV